MKITIEVDRCRDCRFVTNSSREHDDAFSDPPMPVIWVCTKNNGYIINENIIEPNCPFKKERA